MTYLIGAFVGCLVGIAIGFAIIDKPIRTPKRITPELEIKVKDGKADTTFIYVKP